MCWVRQHSRTRKRLLRRRPGTTTRQTGGLHKAKRLSLPACASRRHFSPRPADCPASLKAAKRFCATRCLQGASCSWALRFSQRGVSLSFLNGYPVLGTVKCSPFSPSSWRLVTALLAQRTIGMNRTNPGRQKARVPGTQAAARTRSVRGRSDSPSAGFSFISERVSCAWNAEMFTFLPVLMAVGH